MAEEICGNCKFSRSKVEDDEKSWRKKASTIIKFSCHFSPPTTEGWPSVSDNDWCGRFEVQE